jgi:hypothetical protein
MPAKRRRAAPPPLPNAAEMNHKELTAFFLKEVEFNPERFVAKVWEKLDFVVKVHICKQIINSSFRNDKNPEPFKDV